MEKKNSQGDLRLLTLVELEAASRREKRLASKRAYRCRHKAKIASKKTEWRINSLDKERARTKRYRRRHPEKAAMHRMARRARKYLADRGDVSVEWLRALREAQGDRCLACKVELEGKGELDHLIPLVKGGLHARCNVAWLCRRCNRVKGSKLPCHSLHPTRRWEFLQYWAAATHSLMIRDGERTPTKEG